MKHANGVRSVLAKAISGDDEPVDYWYNVASDVLSVLTEAGFQIVATTNGEQRD